MPGLGAGNGVGRAREEVPGLPRTVGDGVDPEADGRPGLGPRRGSRMLDGPEVTFQEQAVDVNPDVLMVEREICGTRKAEPVRGHWLRCAPRLTRGLAGEEDRPSLLQEREEGHPVGHDLLQRPVGEAPVASQNPDDVLVEDPGHDPVAEVASQEDPEEVCRAPDLLREDLEHVAEHIALSRGVTELARGIVGLRSPQRIEVAPVEAVDHGIAQAREEVGQAERETAASSQQIVRQRGEIGARRS